MASLHELFERFGVAMVFANSLLHELALPLPLTPIVLVAGAANPAWPRACALIAAVVAGAVIGNSIWFAAGRRYGTRVVGWLGHVSLLHHDGVPHATDRLKRWGGIIFVVGRFVPGVFLIVPPLAGALGMRWPKFLVLTALGATFWSVVVVLVGATLERVVFDMVADLSSAPGAIWFSGAGVLTVYIGWRLAYRRRAHMSRVAKRC